MQIDELWLKYNKDVEFLILSKIKNQDIAKDLTQETYIKALTKFDQLKDISKVKHWLLTIARNTALDYFRKDSKIVPLNDYDIEETSITTEKHTIKDCLPGLIESLPKKYKVPIYLSDIQGMKQIDVAKKLNLPLATVKSQIQRARKLIAEGYINCCNFTINKNGFLVGENKEKEDCKICKK